MEQSFSVNELAAIIAKHLGVKSVYIEKVGTYNQEVRIGAGGICNIMVSLSDEQESGEKENHEPAILYGIVVHCRNWFEMQPCHCAELEAEELCGRCSILKLIKGQLELIPIQEKPEYMELMGDKTYMEVLEDSALKASFDHGLALKEAYRDLSKAARTVWALLSMPNLCETCRIRVKGSHYCDACGCVKYKAVRCQDYEV